MPAHSRERRLKSIRKSSSNHPLVHLALSMMDEDGDTLRPLPALGSTLRARLKSLAEPDSLLAAALGLVDLAYLLSENHGSFEAGEVILQALSRQQAQIEAALAALPDEGGTLARLKALGKDDFGESAAKTRVKGPHAEQHLPNAGFELSAAPAKARHKP